MFKISPDGKLIVFIGRRGQIHLLDAVAMTHIDTLQCPSQINSLSFNKDGSRMYTHGGKFVFFLFWLNKSLE